jgi:hypothetical protein
VATWDFNDAGQASGFTMRACSPGDGHGVPQGCGSVAMEPGRGWQVWPAPPAAAAASGVLYYGDSEAKNFDFGANAGTVRTPPVKVPINGNSTLSFRTRWQQEASPYRDRARVLLYVDGKRHLVPPNTAPRYGALWYAGMPGFTQPGVWQTYSYDVTHLSGHTIALEFFFDSVDGLDNGGLGWMVDDLKLVSPCQQS